jgi:hypothetical protein
MTHKAGQLIADLERATDQALQERKFVPIGFSKINEPKRPVALKNDGVGGVLKKASTDCGERRVSAERGELIVILAG